MDFMAEVIGGTPTWFRSCCTRQAALIAAIDFAAAWAWLASVNWAGTATTAVAVIGIFVLGYLNLRSLVHTKQIQWAKEMEAANHTSLTVQIERMTADYKNEAEKAANERRELMDKVTEHAGQRKAILDEMSALNASILRERESIHKQRGEMQRASLTQLEESNILRDQVKDMTSELSEARRELSEARKQIAALSVELEKLRSISVHQAQSTAIVASAVKKQSAQLDQLTGVSSSDEIPTVPPPS